MWGLLGGVVMKDKTKRTITITGSALALASIGFAAVRASRHPVVVKVAQDFHVPAERVIDLIKQVDREPEFIPMVSRVDVLEQEQDHVTYQVHLNLPAPMQVLYTKWWDYNEKLVAWKSHSGSLDVFHKGEIKFEDTDRGCRAYLVSEHKFSAPGGGVMTQASKYPMQWAMKTWMERLAKLLNKKIIGT
jgi:ribosome-associated toxin RatA of RatAB toxin-antitoxin module